MKADILKMVWTKEARELEPRFNHEIIKAHERATGDKLGHAKFHGLRVNGRAVEMQRENLRK